MMFLGCWIGCIYLLSGGFDLGFGTWPSGRRGLWSGRRPEAVRKKEYFY